MSALLAIQRTSIAFGGLKAVQDFNLELPEGALYGLIGPNGAGKTTVFNVLTGVYRPDDGTIRLDGRDLIGLKPHQIAAAGMSRTFQNIRLFPHLSVLDNVRIACHLRGKHALVPTILRFPKQQAEEKEAQANEETDNGTGGNWPPEGNQIFSLTILHDTPLLKQVAIPMELVANRSRR